MDDRTVLRAREEVDVVPLTDRRAGFAFRTDPPGVVRLSRFTLATLLCLDGRPVGAVADDFTARLGPAGAAANGVRRSLWLAIGQLHHHRLLEEVPDAC